MNKFRVELLDCKNENSEPITVSIYVDNTSDVSYVKKYIMDQKYGLFSHASGPDGEYY